MIEFVLAAGLLGMAAWCCFVAVRHSRPTWAEATALGFCTWWMGQAVMWALLCAIAGSLFGLVAAGVARLVLR